MNISDLVAPPHPGPSFGVPTSGEPRGGHGHLPILPQFVIGPDPLISLRLQPPGRPRHHVLSKLPLHRRDDPLGAGQRIPYPFCSAHPAYPSA